MGSDAPSPGLREVRKQRTHGELLRAGLDLFRAHGYGRTTVSDIARRGDVSERTFFRYFGSKEDLVLHPIREASARFRDEVAGRPAEETPLGALREACRTTVTGIVEDPMGLCLSALRVICADPAARVACLRFGLEEQLLLGGVLAAREGTPPGDPRPTLLAGIFTVTALQAAFSWDVARGVSAEGLLSATDEHVAALRSALAADWRGGGH
ncbi:TetR/AcrR family transcriptional regulator [Streptomyces avicenniae]|uniref:TetR/AcrR family transcriptional regulator n=1 Tax=Streptomyces avicenniae TaxID=500153 RepID=UPI00069C6A1D|nr:TetR/AcrR family transcriptional regulator [Streptomyces avicenniae]